MRLGGTGAAGRTADCRAHVARAARAGPHHHTSGFWKETPAENGRPSPQLPAALLWGMWGRGVGRLGQPRPLSSRIPARDPTTAPSGRRPPGTAGKNEGAPGSVPGWHPRDCANLLTHARVVSLLVPTVIL